MDLLPPLNFQGDNPRPSLSTITPYCASLIIFFFAFCGCCLDLPTYCCDCEGVVETSFYERNVT